MHTAWMIALWLMAGAAGDKPLIARAPHVRATPAAARVLEEAAERSPTVRGLLERLAASDLIVYVEITAVPDVTVARTKLVTATPLARFVRIGINASLPLRDRPAFLGHELQHALEISEHAEVRDDLGVRRLYQSIGHQHGPNGYETDAAMQVERAVRAELHRSGDM